MKFKYHFYEKKLWRIKDNYLYEISEQNRQIEHVLYIGVKIRFNLGENCYLFLNDDDELGTKKTVCYAKPLANGEFAYYQKKLTPSWFQVETVIEFSEADRVQPIEQRTPI